MVGERGIERFPSGYLAAARCRQQWRERVRAELEEASQLSGVRPCGAVDEIEQLQDLSAALDDILSSTEAVAEVVP